MTFDNFVKIYKLSKYWRAVTVTVSGDKSLSLYYNDKFVEICYDDEKSTFCFKTSSIDLIGCPMSHGFSADLTNGRICISVPSENLKTKGDAAKLLNWVTKEIIEETEITRNPFKRFFKWLKKLVKRG